MVIKMAYVKYGKQNDVSKHSADNNDFLNNLR